MEVISKGLHTLATTLYQHLQLYKSVSIETWDVDTALLIVVCDTTMIYVVYR